uniref:Fibronectin type-III domain-containing protein n=2 Tax=Clytia hemisphaerica TaxID=252671 RepID=A0A7M5XFI6_9CNID
MQRLAEKEAEMQRLAEEAEKQRIAEEEAEKERLEKIPPRSGPVKLIPESELQAIELEVSPAVIKASHTEVQVEVFSSKTSTIAQTFEIDSEFSTTTLKEALVDDVLEEKSVSVEDCVDVESKERFVESQEHSKPKNETTEEDLTIVSEVEKDKEEQLITEKDEQKEGESQSDQLNIGQVDEEYDVPVSKAGDEETEDSSKDTSEVIEGSADTEKVAEVEKEDANTQDKEPESIAIRQEVKINGESGSVKDEEESKINEDAIAQEEAPLPVYEKESFEEVSRQETLTKIPLVEETDHVASLEDVKESSEDESKPVDVESNIVEDDSKSVVETGNEESSKETKLVEIEDVTTVEQQSEKESNPTQEKAVENESMPHLQELDPELITNTDEMKDDVMSHDSGVESRLTQKGGKQSDSEMESSGPDKEYLDKEWKAYEWSKCIPTIRASFLNPNTINVEWSLPNDAKTELINGFFLYVDGVPRGHVFSDSTISASGLKGGRSYEVAIVVFPVDKEAFKIAMSNLLFITCPSVSKAGGPIISISSNLTPRVENDDTAPSPSSRDDNITEPILSWMAGFHPDKTPECFTLFVNGIAQEEKIRPQQSIEEYCTVQLKNLQLDKLYKISVHAHIEEETVSSNTLFFTVPFNKSTLTYSGDLYKEETQQNISLADNRDLPDSLLSQIQPSEEISCTAKILQGESYKQLETEEILLIQESVPSLPPPVCGRTSQVSRISTLDTIAESENSTYHDDDAVTITDVHEHSTSDVNEELPQDSMCEDVPDKSQSEQALQEQFENISKDLTSKLVSKSLEDLSQIQKEEEELKSREEVQSQGTPNLEETSTELPIESTVDEKGVSISGPIGKNSESVDETKQVQETPEEDTPTGKVEQEDQEAATETKSIVASDSKETSDLEESGRKDIEQSEEKPVEAITETLTAEAEETQDNVVESDESIGKSQEIPDKPEEVEVREQPEAETEETVKEIQQAASETIGVVTEEAKSEEKPQVGVSTEDSDHHTFEADQIPAGEEHNEQKEEVEENKEEESSLVKETQEQPQHDDEEEKPHVAEDPGEEKEQQPQIETEPSPAAVEEKVIESQPLVNSNEQVAKAIPPEVISVKSTAGSEIDNKEFVEALEAHHITFEDVTHLGIIAPAKKLYDQETIDEETESEKELPLWNKRPSTVVVYNDSQEGSDIKPQRSVSFHESDSMKEEESDPNYEIVAKGVIDGVVRNAVKEVLLSGKDQRLAEMQQKLQEIEQKEMMLLEREMSIHKEEEMKRLHDLEEKEKELDEREKTLHFREEQQLLEEIERRENDLERLETTLEQKERQLREKEAEKLAKEQDRLQELQRRQAIEEIRNKQKELQDKQNEYARRELALKEEKLKSIQKDNEKADEEKRHELQKKEDELRDKEDEIQRCESELSMKLQEAELQKLAMEEEARRMKEEEKLKLIEIELKARESQLNNREKVLEERIAEENDKIQKDKQKYEEWKKKEADDLEKRLEEAEVMIKQRLEEDERQKELIQLQIQQAAEKAREELLQELLEKEEAEKQRLAEEEAEKQRLAEEEAENQRLAAEEAEKQRLAEEAEKQRLVAEEAEKRRLAEEAEKRRLAEEAEKQRLKEEETEKQRLAAEEAEKQRLAEEEAEKQRIAEEEAEKQRLAEEEEAEKQRTAEEEAEKQRLAEEEAEKQRLAEEAEKQRLVEEEAEKQKLAAEEAEKQRLAEEEAEEQIIAAEEAEKQRLAAEEAEKQRLAEEDTEKQRIAAEEAEKQRLAEEEAEKQRLAEEEAERQRLADEEAVKQRLDAEEAEKLKLAEEKKYKDQLHDIAKEVVSECLCAAENKIQEVEEAENQRIAEEEVEKQRLAEEEAEKQRFAAEEAEKQRLAEEEAEKQRLAAEEAEKQRLAVEEAERNAKANELTENVVEMSLKEVLEEETINASSVLTTETINEAEKEIFNEYVSLQPVQIEIASRRLAQIACKESVSEVYEEEIQASAVDVSENASNTAEKEIFDEFVSYQANPEAYVMKRSVDSNAEHLANKSSVDAVAEVFEEDLVEASVEVTQEAIDASEKEVFTEMEQLVAHENDLLVKADELVSNTVDVSEKEVFGEMEDLVAKLDAESETKNDEESVEGEKVVDGKVDIVTEKKEEKEGEIQTVVDSDDSKSEVTEKRVVESEEMKDIPQADASVSEESKDAVQNETSEVVDTGETECHDDDVADADVEDDHVGVRITPPLDDGASDHKDDSFTKETIPTHLTDTMTSELEEEMVLNNTMDNCQVEVIASNREMTPTPKEEPIAVVAKRDLKDLELQLLEKEKERQSTYMIEETRIRKEREILMLQQEELKNERLKLELEAERARLSRLQEKQKEEEKRHQQELEEMRYRTDVLKEHQVKEKEKDQEHQKEIEKLKTDLLAKSAADKITHNIADEALENTIDEVANDADDTQTPPSADPVTSTPAVKLTSSGTGRKVLPDIPTIAKIHKATEEEANTFKQMKKLKVSKIDVEELTVTSPRSDDEGLANLSAGRNISAQNMKRSSRNKLSQGLDISVRSTDNNKLRLQWDWTPSTLNSGFRVWYSVLVLGTKFGPNINSHKSYKFHNSPLPESWPMTNREKMKELCVQHCWDTYGKIMDIKGLKARYTYRICVLGRRDRNGQRLTFGHIQFTMPGPPSRPVLRIEKLGDREVTFSWDAVTSYGDAFLCGYQLIHNGEPSGSIFTPDVLTATITNLEPGTTNIFSLIALSKHSIGNSRPSRTLKIKCPAMPHRVDEVFQVDTNQLGVILLTWQVPAMSDEQKQEILTQVEITDHQSDDEDQDENNNNPPQQQKNNEKPSKISCYLARVDGELYGKCEADANEQDYVGYEIGNCAVGQEYNISVASYCEPKPFQKDDRKVTCGCSSLPSQQIRCAPVSPPKSPKPFIKSINTFGIELAWERAREYSSAALSGYYIQINKMIYGDRLPADSLSTIITDLHPGLDYKISLIALTEHPVGKQRQTRDYDETSAYDSTYNSEDDDVISYDESYDEPHAPSRPPAKSKHAFTKSFDSGQRTQSTFSGGDELVNFMQTVKGQRNGHKVLEQYSSCKPGPTLGVNYNNLVVPPDHVDVSDVLGKSVQLMWNFSLPKNIRNTTGLILVRPEVFCVMYWKRGESMATAKQKETKGTRMFISDLKPGTDYDIIVEARAKHQNQRDAWDPHDPYLCKEQGPVNTFRTGHPPITPTEFSIIGGTTKSLKLAWNEPIVRGVKVSKYLLAISGPSPPPMDLTSTQDSAIQDGGTPRSVKGGKSSKGNKKYIVSNSLQPLEIVPRVYEVPADTVIYEVRNLVERTEYQITLHMVTPHSDADKIKQLYDNPANVSTVENDIWTPYVSTKGVTAGIDPPEYLHVTKREANALTFEWKPAKAYGMYNLLYYVIRWSEVESEEGEFMTSRDKLPSLRNKRVGAMRIDGDQSAITITNIYPGLHYEAQVEACFGSGKKDSENNMVVSEIALTNKVTAWSRAQPASPKLLLRSINQDEFEFTWDRPVLLNLDTKKSVNMEASSTLRRTLLGYRLEINFEECIFLSPSVTSYVYKHPKPGQTYAFMLSAVTCSTENAKEHRAKWQEYMAQQHAEECNELASDITISFPMEDIDEANSEVVSLNTPLRHEVIQFDWLHCKYSKQGSRNTALSTSRSDAKQHAGEEDSENTGNIVVRYKITGKEIEIESLKIHWTCLHDGEEEHFEDDLEYDSRGYEITKPKQKAIYSVRVEAILEEYGSPVTISSPLIYCQIPGPPDEPLIACRQIAKNGFNLEWNEPQTYGGNEVGGYHVYVNGSRLGKVLPSTCRSCTIPCRPGRTYKVHTVALSCDPAFPESGKSNELIINTQSDNYQKNSPRSGKGSEKRAQLPTLDVHLSSCYDDALEIEWHQPMFGDGTIIDSYTVQWSSLIHPKPQTIGLPGSQQDFVIGNLNPGTSYFVHVIAYNGDKQIVARSTQLDGQTTAVVDTPILRVGTCTGTRIELEWSKPKTYGDARIEKYLLRLDNCDYADVSNDQNSFVFSMCEPGTTYTFQLQAVSTKTGYNSEFSKKLIVTCPGGVAPDLGRVKTTVANCIKVCWKKPALKGAAQVKSYWVYYCPAKAGIFKVSPSDVINDPSVVAHGPLPGNTDDDALEGVNPCEMYNVLLQVDLTPDDCPTLFSEPLRTKAAMPPNPPRITAEIVGMEERVQLEEALHHMVSRRDRLCREINLLRGMVVIKHLADRDEEIARLSQMAGKLDMRIKSALKEVRKYTGTVKVILRWSFPGHDGDAVADGYKIFINGKQYSSDLSVHTTNAMVELPCDPRPHQISVITTTKHPVGSSPDSNTLNISTEEFFPFSFFCYFDTHIRGARFPHVGCCNYEETLQVEASRKHDKPGKPIAYRGTLDKKVPPPSAEAVELRTGEWKPIYDRIGMGSGKPTFVLFWTKWCRASIRLMNFLTKYAEENGQDFAFVTCCTHSGESTKTHLHKLNETFEQHGWSDMSSVRHLCACEQNMDAHLIRRRLSVNRFALSTTAELFGVVGVPSIMVIDKDGMISWQGRYCALNYNSFSLFMRHLYSTVMRLPCDVHDCVTCSAEAHQDFKHTEDLLPSQGAESTTYKPNLFPAFTPSGRSKKDIKKKLKSRHRGASDKGSSPRELAMRHIAMATTPRVQNPYEEEFIEEIFLPKETKTNKGSGKGAKSALFPYIPQSPPTRPKRIRIATGASRRTVSAPGVETSSLKTLLSKT